VNVEGMSHSRTFFSRTNPAAAQEAAKLDNDKVSVASSSGENGTSVSQRHTTYAGNSLRGGQSKRFARDGRGRSNFHQQNGYRKPAAQNATCEQPPATPDEQQAFDAVGKTQHNSSADSPPSSLEIPSSRHDQPLPQRNNQRQSYSRDDPPPPPSTSATIESTTET